MYPLIEDMKKTVTSTIIIILSLVAVIAIAVWLVRSKSVNETAGKYDVQSGGNEISVSIPPLKYLVDRITGGEVAVNVILPPGSSPETYEPTPRSLKALDDSRMIFVTGLIDFETVIMHRTGHENTIPLLSENIDLIQGDHSHHHHHKGHAHHHSHGADPHIWVSPAYLKEMAGIILRHLSTDPDDEIYMSNYQSLINDIDATDEYIRSAVAGSGVRSFLIYHPALTYYARDYGLEQLQLEYDGKEPSAEKLRGTLDRARAEGLNKILYQKEFSIKAVKTAAKSLGAVPVEIDPLDEDILGNLRTITDIITGREAER